MFLMFQVYDLAAHSPAEVLGYGLGCLDKLAASDECARLTRQNLRILVRSFITASLFLRKSLVPVDV